jgi:adenylate cyclase
MTDRVDPEDLEQLGLDLSAPDSADVIRLVRNLLDQGAEAGELREAINTGTTGPLALDLALRGRTDVAPFRQATEAVGLEPAGAAQLWRALGFPDPLRSETKLTGSEARALALLAGLSQQVQGGEGAFPLARVIGSSLALMAEAMVDAYRVGVEMPRRHAGEPHAQIVADYAQTVPALLTALDDAFHAIFRAHLLGVARGAWALDESQAAVTRQLTVGFADLVGYTQSARSLSPGELAGAIDRFESLVGDVVGAHDGRVVKLIGDEAMFTAGDAAAACRLAGALNRQIQADELLPAVRIGLASGPVVGLRGDYYGDVVNLAARLVKVAEPGQVLMSAPLARELTGRIEYEPVEVPPLKGYDEPVAAFRLRI